MIKNKYLGLHFLFLIYSCGSIFTKLASGEKFLSIKFCAFYGCQILILMVYAIGWQQVIKKMPLSTAFSNKAINLMWGILWGVMIFDEMLTIGKIIGGIIVIVGIIVFSHEKKVAHDE